MSTLAPWLVLLSLTASTDVQKLEVRQVGDVTYFRVTLKAPADLLAFDPDTLRTPNESSIRRRGQLPQLVPLDQQPQAVYLDVEQRSGEGKLRFVGRRAGPGKTAALRLLYPTQAKVKKGLAGLPRDANVSTAVVKLDLNDAVEVGSTDLQKAWAKARAYHLEGQHLRAPGSGLFPVAYELNNRKHFPGSAALSTNDGRSGSLLETLLGGEGDRLFEMTTGATALTESLALGRLRQPPKGDKVNRTRSVRAIQGIDVAEHPWKKMMGDKKPAEEPFARLVPHDNWYFTVHEPAAFLSAWELLDTWGGSVLRSPKLLDRDHGVRARYERQLCLPSKEFLRAAPAGLVRDIALTGSDLFFVEGTDVTVLLDVDSPAAFTKVHDRYLAAERKAHGQGLNVTSETFQGVEVQGFATPRREVSLYRATLGKIMVCSNSPTAIRHILNAHAGKRPALADSLDFQYMRTVFVRDAKQEDGFAFLSDPFVRRLVSPATRIKAMRRSDARAAMQLASHAALFVGLDQGKIPTDTKSLLTQADLKPNVLTIPDGPSVVWDGARATSDLFNTLEFTTPLVELPIDAVSPDEERGYELFREEYLRLWRRFFDPVGIRFKLGPEPLRVEVYLLPLVNNSEYNGLRRMAGGGTVRFSPSRIPPTAVMRFLTRLPGEDDWLKKVGIGDWGLALIDATDLNLEPIVRYGIESELGRLGKEPDPELVPLLLSVGATDPKMVRNLVRNLLDPSKDGKAPEGKKYRDVATTEYKKESPFLPKHLYDAMPDKAYALTWNRSLLERWIDGSLDAPKGKPKDEVEVNTSLYLAPPGGKNVEAISAALEWETHKRALSAVAMWQALCSAGAITPTMNTDEKAAVARRLLGFVPASPDGTAFVVDKELNQIKNERHGSLSRPAYHAALGTGSSVTNLFSQVRSLRVDLRFREDGIHTTMTIDWNAARK